MNGTACFASLRCPIRALTPTQRILFSFDRYFRLGTNPGALECFASKNSTHPGCRCSVAMSMFSSFAQFLPSAIQSTITPHAAPPTEAEERPPPESNFDPCNTDDEGDEEELLRQQSQQMDEQDGDKRRIKSKKEKDSSKMVTEVRAISPDISLDIELASDLHIRSATSIQNEPPPQPPSATRTTIRQAAVRGFSA